jgi:hypothetical protein
VQHDEAQQRVEVEAELQPFMQEIRTRMRSEDPLALMGLVSGIIAASDGRHGFPDRSAIALEDFVDSVIDIDIAETTAVLHALAVLLADTPTRGRVESALQRRRQPMPRWLAELPETTVTAAARTSFPGEPGGNLLLEFHWPGGVPGVYIVFDQGAGRGVKDAFPVPGLLDEVLERFQGIAHGPQMTVRPLELTTARATLAEALALGAGRSVEEETETWPMGRPLVEWLLTLMPAGGTPLPQAGTVAPSQAGGASGWQAAGRPTVGVDPDDVMEEFAESSEAAEIGFDLQDDSDHSSLGAIVACGWKLGATDPLVWDADRVDELFTEWLPRTVLPDPVTARRLPVVAEAYVLWAADRSGEGRRHKAALARAVRAAAPKYLNLATSRIAQSLRSSLMDYEELTGMWDEFDLGAIGADAGGSPAGLAGPGTDDGVVNRFLFQLAREVGGLDALASLDDTPLPDEPFDASTVPDDIVPRVDEVRLLVDDFADRSFGVEFRTACRRFLARVAAGDPEIFRRKSRAATTAAAIAWTVGRPNDLVAAGGAAMAAKDLMAHFGLKGSVSQRAQVLVNALPTGSYDAHGPELGTPDLLVSSKRAQLIGVRELAVSGHLFGD